jgi:hypothetical protein
VAALILAAGAVIHAAAFPKVLSAVATSDVQTFAGNSLKVLWLADSATSLLIASLFLIIATRPSAVAPSAIIVLALVPSVTALLIYIFMGNFVGGHILLAAAVAAIVGAIGLAARASDR